MIVSHGRPANFAMSIKSFMFPFDNVVIMLSFLRSCSPGTESGQPGGNKSVVYIHCQITEDVPLRRCQPTTNRRRPSASNLEASSDHSGCPRRSSRIYESYEDTGRRYVRDSVAQRYGVNPR